MKLDCECRYTYETYGWHEFLFFFFGALERTSVTLLLTVYNRELTRMVVPLTYAIYRWMSASRKVACQYRDVSKPRGVDKFALTSLGSFEARVLETNREIKISKEREST